MAETGRLQKIPIGYIQDNPNNPRRKMDADKMAGMVESVKANGILEPILVRQCDGGYFMVVAGSRRLKAAKKAGLKEVPAILMDVNDDAAALNVSIVENLQHEDMHELDEAIGYQALMRSGMEITGIAAKCGKDESYVYKRLRLLDLIEPAQKAFIDGEINAGHALLIARLQPVDQERALKACFTDQFGYLNREDQRPRSVSSLNQWITSNVALKISDAPFKLSDDRLLDSVPPCRKCPKRTGFNRQLFDDIKEKDLCTDPACFQEKVKAHVARSLAQAEKRKRPFVQISSDYQSHGWKEGDPIHSSKYQVVREGEKCSSAEQAIVVHGRDTGRTMEICRDERCSVHGRSISGHSADTDKYRKQQKREEEKRKRRREVRRRILDAVLDRTKELLGLPETELQLLGIWNLLGSDLQRAIATRRGWEKIERKGGYGIDYDAMLVKFLNGMDPEEATRLAVEISLAQQMDSDPGAWGGRDRLMEFAKLKKIDGKKIESQVAAELKEKAKGKAKRGKAKKSKTAKKALKEDPKQEAATDPAEGVCQNCAASDGEPRECGHVICEECHSGACPVCAEEVGL